MYDNDPLWKLRHALAGLALALLGSVLLAALIGRVLGDALEAFLKSLDSVTLADLVGAPQRGVLHRVRRSA